MKKIIYIVNFSFFLFTNLQAQFLASETQKLCFNGKCDSLINRYNYFYDSQCQLTDFFVYGRYIFNNGGEWTEFKRSADGLTVTEVVRDWDAKSFTKNYSAKIYDVRIKTYDKTGKIVKFEYRDKLNPSYASNVILDRGRDIIDAKGRKIMSVGINLDYVDPAKFFVNIHEYSYDECGNLLKENAYVYDSLGKAGYQYQTINTYSYKDEINGKTTVKFSATNYSYHDSIIQTHYTKDSTYVALDGLTQINYNSYNFNTNNLEFYSRELDTFDKVNNTHTTIHQILQNGKFVNNQKLYKTPSFSRLYTWGYNSWFQFDNYEFIYGCNQLPAVVDTTTHITTESGWKIYPNPANEQVLIDNGATFSFQDGTINVYTTAGKFVKSERLNYLPYTLDVFDIPHGAYIIKISGDNYNVAQKLMIQK